MTVHRFSAEESMAKAKTQILDPACCTESVQYFHAHESRSHPDHCHNPDHCHVPDVSWRLVTMIALNGIVFGAELVTGFVTHSLSLQSDAWHMLSDEASLVIGLVAHQMSKRSHTPTMPFGFGRLEVLGGLVNATFLLAICLTIAVDAIERFTHPPELEQPQLFVIVGVIGLITNLVGLLMFHNHSHSDNIRGVFLHVLGDFIGSIGVIATGVLHFTSLSPMRIYADPVFSLVIVAILVRGSLELFERTATILIQKCPADVNIGEVEMGLRAIEGVFAVHDLHIWELSKDRRIADLHVVVKSREDEVKIVCQVQNLMIAHGVHNVTVQIECQGDFPHGIEAQGHCAFASAIGRGNRVFVTAPAYRHAIGCPHSNSGEQPDHSPA
jgi:zinc transporter 1